MPFHDDEKKELIPVTTVTSAVANSGKKVNHSDNLTGVVPKENVRPGHEFPKARHVLLVVAPVEDGGKAVQS